MANDKMIISGASVFLVVDVAKAADYYRDCLGFKYDKLWGDPPGFCMAWRNDQCVMLSRTRNAGLIRPVSTVVTEIWDAYFWVNDADAFFEEMKSAGAKIKHGPVVKMYGVKEFAVLDLDGYQLAFGEELDEE